MLAITADHISGDSIMLVRQCNVWRRRHMHMDMPTQGNAPAPAIFKKLSYQSHGTLIEGGRCKQRRFMWGKAERSYYPGTHPGHREGSWLNCRAGRVRITGAVRWNGVIKFQKPQIPETSSGVERGEKVPHYLPWKMKLYICIIK